MDNGNSGQGMSHSSEMQEAPEIMWFVLGESIARSTPTVLGAIRCIAQDSRLAWDNHLRRVRRKPIDTMLEMAGTGMAAGALAHATCSRRHTRNNKEKMMQRTEMSSQNLKDKIDRLEKQIRNLSSESATKLRDRFEDLKEEAMRRYEHGSEAAREYVTEHPAKATLTATMAGFAFGYLAHMLWRRQK